MSKQQHQVQRKYFTQLCAELGIWLYDGLKLFTKSSHINEVESSCIPFIGRGLNKPPYNFMVVNTWPEDIMLNAAAENEIRLRCKRMSPHLKELLKMRLADHQERNRYRERKNRNELKIWNGITTEFSGNIQKYAYVNESIIDICITDVTFLGEDRIIADHMWLRIPRKEAEVILSRRNKTKDSTLSFTGTVKPYRRYDKFERRLKEDMGVVYQTSMLQ